MSMHGRNHTHNEIAFSGDSYNSVRMYNRLTVVHPSSVCWNIIPKFVSFQSLFDETFTCIFQTTDCFKTFINYFYVEPDDR